MFPSFKKRYEEKDKEVKELLAEIVPKLEDAPADVKADLASDLDGALKEVEDSKGNGFRGNGRT